MSEKVLHYCVTVRRENGPFDPMDGYKIRGVVGELARNSVLAGEPVFKDGIMVVNVSGIISEHELSEYFSEFGNVECNVVRK